MQIISQKINVFHSAMEIRPVIFTLIVYARTARKLRVRHGAPLLLM